MATSYLDCPAIPQLDSQHQQYSPNIRTDISLASLQPKRIEFKGFHFSYITSPRVDPHKIPVLFLSGAFQNMQSWHRFAKYFLKAGIPIILIDLPGTGQADILPLKFGLEYLSSALDYALDEISCDKVSIVSASYGTPIGYYFSQRFSSKVDSLVLAGTMKEIPSNLRFGVQHTLALLRKGNMEEFANEVIGLTGPQRGNGLICFDPNKQIARRNLAYRVLFTQLVNMNSLERDKYELNTLRLLHHEALDLHRPPKCRTLVFTGEHDTFTRPEYCRTIASTINPCTFTTIKHADHLFHIEQFSTTAELLYGFTQAQPLESIRLLNKIEYFC